MADTIEKGAPDTEEKILAAASEVFLRRGTAGARMAEIADEAGVNQALLHYYFRTKADLATVAFQRSARELFPRVIRILLSDAELEEKVERVVELELDFLLEHRFLPGYILSELTHHPERVEELIAALAGSRVGEFAPRLLEGIGRQIDAAVEAGRLRPIAPEAFVVNLLALCIFPFAARPLVSALAGLDDAGFAAMIERRKAELPVFFFEGLRP